jgi:hypothetical protein
MNRHDIRIMVVLAIALIVANAPLTCRGGVPGEVETDNLKVWQEGMFYGSVVIEALAFTTTNSLKLYYDFDTSTNPVPDISGNSNVGTVNGATWTTNGKFGGGYTFVTANDFITAGDKFDLIGSVTDLTVSVWVRPTATNLQDAVLGKQDLESGVYKGWMLFLNNGRPFAELMANYNLGQRAYSESSVAIDTNAWHFLVAQFHVDTNNMWSAIWVDGTLMATNCRQGAHASMDTSAELEIGRRAGIWPYHGAIDDVRIYDRWLSGTEIAGLPNKRVTNATARIAVPTTIDHLVRQGDIEMGTFTNEP